MTENEWQRTRTQDLRDSSSGGGEDEAPTPPGPGPASATAPASGNGERRGAHHRHHHHPNLTDLGNRARRALTHQQHHVEEEEGNATSSKPTMLCLHGYRSNAEIATLQVENLGLTERFAVHTLHGPIEGSDPADEGVALLSRGPYYSWMELGDRTGPAKRGGSRRRRRGERGDRVAPTARDDRPARRNGEDNVDTDGEGGPERDDDAGNGDRRDVDRDALAEWQQGKSKFLSRQGSSLSKSSGHSTKHIGVDDVMMDGVEKGSGAMKSDKNTAEEIVDVENALDSTLRAGNRRLASGAVSSEQRHHLRGSPSTETVPIEDESDRSLGHGQMHRSSSARRLRIRTEGRVVEGMNIDENIDELMASLRLILEHVVLVLKTKFIDRQKGERAGHGGDAITDEEVGFDTEAQSSPPELVAYDGVYAFSQSASLVAILSCDSTRLKLLEKFGMIRPRDEPVAAQGGHHTDLRQMLTHAPGAVNRFHLHIQGNMHGASNAVWEAIEDGNFKPWNFVVLACAANVSAWRAVQAVLRGGGHGSVPGTHGATILTTKERKRSSLLSSVGTSDDEAKRSKRGSGFSKRLSSVRSSMRSSFLSSGGISDDGSKCSRRGGGLVQRLSSMMSVASSAGLDEDSISGNPNPKIHRHPSDAFTLDPELAENDEKDKTRAMVRRSSTHTLGSQASAIQDTFSRSTLTVPSVHIIGVNDPLKPDSEYYLNAFRADLAMPMYLDCEHEIPAFLKRKSLLLQEVMIWRQLCFERQRLALGSLNILDHWDDELLRSIYDESDGDFVLFGRDHLVFRRRSAIVRGPSRIRRDSFLASITSNRRDSNESSHSQHSRRLSNRCSATPHLHSSLSSDTDKARGRGRVAQRRASMGAALPSMAEGMSMQAHSHPVAIAEDACVPIVGAVAQRRASMGAALPSMAEEMSMQAHSYPVAIAEDACVPIVGTVHGRDGGVPSRRPRRRASLGGISIDVEEAQTRTPARSSSLTGDFVLPSTIQEGSGVPQSRQQRRLSMGAILPSPLRRGTTPPNTEAPLPIELLRRKDCHIDDVVPSVFASAKLITFRERHEAAIRKSNTRKRCWGSTQSDDSDEDMTEDVPRPDFEPPVLGQYYLNGLVPSTSTILDMLLSADPQRPALISPGSTTEILTYHDIVSFVRVEGDLRRLGATAKSLVAYVPPPGAAGVTSAMAFLTISSQCSSAPLDPSYKEKDYAAAFKQLKPDIVIVFDPSDSTEVLKAAAGTKFKCRCFIATPISGRHGLFTYANAVSKEEIAFDKKLFLSEPLVSEADGTGLILRTSGTTSEPKVVPLKAGSIVANARAIAKSLDLTPGDTALNAMPLFHIGGLSANLLSSLAAGGSVILMDQFDADSFLSIITGRSGVKPTWFSAVPTMHATITAAAKSSKSIKSLDFKHSLRFIRSGAAALPLPLAKKMESVFGCPVVTTYSMTEQMPISQPPGPISLTALKPRSVGKPLASSLCIVDNTLRPLPYGSGIRGEICICGPSVFEGYRSNQSANAKSFFYFGSMKWFRTGDMGYLDEEGYLFLTGRNKEMIKRGGEQVNPIELEEVCGKHPSIALCVAFAIPDKLWGQRVGMAVVLKEAVPGKADPLVRIPSSSDEMVKELKSLVISVGLQEFKAPEHVVFVSEGQIPKTASRKIVRVNMASALGVKPLSDDLMERLQDLKPVRISDAISGVRFLLAFAVLFGHIGDFGESINHARDFCLHMPAFFFIGGFMLAVGTQKPVVNDLQNFYALRLAVLHPMYLLALLCAVINFSMRCTPANYIDSFEMGRYPEEGDEFVCQSTPMEASYGVTMMTSLLVHIFCLQAWPFSPFISWFLLSYAWFQSVYYFLILVFPWIHKAFYTIRHSKKKLGLRMGLSFAALYCVVALFFIYLPLADANMNAANYFALTAYLFPVGWLPCFCIGIGSYYVLALYRPNEKRSAWKWGALTDILTLAMLAVFLLFGLADDMTTSDNFDAGIDKRFFAYFMSRAIAPVIFVWLFGLAVGKGMTAKLLSNSFLVSWLAPASYNVYLFHQVVAEWYYLATRGEWWAYPKSFYWFSPYATPLPWWEFLIVGLLVTLLSMILEFYVNGRLVELSTRLVRALPGSKHATVQVADNVHDTVISIIKKITSVEVTPETSLLDTGLSSMTTLLLVSDIKDAYRSLRLAAKDVFGAKTVGGLIALIESKLDEEHKENHHGADGLGNVPLDAHSFHGRDE